MPTWFGAKDGQTLSAFGVSSASAERALAEDTPNEDRSLSNLQGRAFF